MPESTTPVPVCPIHATFMVPCIPEHEAQRIVSPRPCFKCANLNCRLVYVYGGVAEGYYRLENTGELKRVFPVAGRTDPMNECRSSSRFQFRNPSICLSSRAPCVLFRIARIFAVPREPTTRTVSPGFSFTSFVLLIGSRSLPHRTFDILST
jgi:hypothetical protein